MFSSSIRLPASLSKRCQTDINSTYLVHAESQSTFLLSPWGDCACTMVRSLLCRTHTYNTCMMKASFPRWCVLPVQPACICWLWRHAQIRPLIKSRQMRKQQRGRKRQPCSDFRCNTVRQKTQHVEGRGEYSGTTTTTEAVDKSNRTDKSILGNGRS